MNNHELDSEKSKRLEREAQEAATPKKEATTLAKHPEADAPKQLTGNTGQTVYHQTGGGHIVSEKEVHHLHKKKTG